MYQSYEMAKEALQLHLYGLEEDGKAIPLPRPAESIIDGEGIVILVRVEMGGFREEMKESEAERR